MSWLLRSVNWLDRAALPQYCRAMAEASPTHPFIVARDQGPAIDLLRGAVVAIGNFDGVHRGHQAVIQAALDRARATHRPAAALTFEPHPRSFFHPDAPSFRLTSEAAKLRLLAATGLDGAVVLTFDAALAGLTAEQFVSDILVDRLGIKGAAIGFNFHFGRERRGSPDFLEAQGHVQGFLVRDGLHPRILLGESKPDSEALAAIFIKPARPVIFRPEQPFEGTSGAHDAPEANASSRRWPGYTSRLSPGGRGHLYGCREERRRPLEKVPFYAPKLLGSFANNRTLTSDTAGLSRRVRPGGDAR